jgi:hypothetical protein
LNRLWILEDQALYLAVPYFLLQHRCLHSISEHSPYMKPRDTRLFLVHHHA